MRKFAALWLSACLPIFASCSNSSDRIVSAPRPAYQGIPAGLMERCTVQDVPQETIASVIESRGIYIKAFKLCAAKVDAIRDHDAGARGEK
ncbi:Rz1-like lysis system protein LysC [Novosphingobium guangzhouense]|uniref:Rz1-like lysis system protein LysC n=1 Tax=Novosphingobium guangzhouense TaxID=1850347 RepID=UPI003CCBE27F